MFSKRKFVTLLSILGASLTMYLLIPEVKSIFESHPCEKGVSAYGCMNSDYQFPQKHPVRIVSSEQRLWLLIESELVRLGHRALEVDGKPTEETLSGLRWFLGEIPKTFTPETLQQIFDGLRALETRNDIQPGEEFQDCEFCPQMVVIPSGSFMKGSQYNPSLSWKGVNTPSDIRQDENGMQRAPRETDAAYIEPRRFYMQRIFFENSFAVSKFEVTVGEWKHCVADGACKNYDRNHSGKIIKILPNMAATLKESKRAQEYVTWLSQKTNIPFRLLTESEWEFSARGGTMTRFYSGSVLTREHADILLKSSLQETRDALAKTSIVGSFSPNPFGLHDMHGNVSEVIFDCLTPYNYASPSDGSAPLFDENRCDRVVKKGGSFSRYTDMTISGRFPSHGPVGIRIARALRAE